VNSKVTLIISILVATWTVYGLVARGEAMSKAVTPFR
jgi:hypothetical protein